MSKKLFVLFTLFVFLISFTFSDAAQANTPSKNPTSNQLVVDELGYSEAELEKIFKAVEDIPMSVARQGEQATTKWLENYLGEKVTLVSSVPPTKTSDNTSVRSVNVVGCVSAVGIALAGNFFAPAKLLKVKSAIKAAGGATTFVKTLISTYKAARAAKATKQAAISKGINAAAKAAGPEAKAALLDFFYIGSIYSACFE